MTHFALGFIYPVSVEIDANSALFNTSSDYLSKTYSTSSTVTVSGWVKFNTANISTSIFNGIVTRNADGTVTAFGSTTTQKCQDVSSWYHIYASSNGIYINGSLSTSATSSALTNNNIGSGTGSFYGTHFAIVDSTEAVTSFRNNDAPKNISSLSPDHWIKFGDSLDMGFNSGTGGDWTVNGTVEHTSDSPENNIAILDPSTAYSIGSMSLSNGNRTVIGQYGIRATWGVSTGKWKFRWKHTNGSGFSVGVADDRWDIAEGGNPNSTNAWTYKDGSAYEPGSTSVTDTFTASVNGRWNWVCLDADSGKMWIGDEVNGWYNSGDPEAGTNPIHTGMTASGGDFFFVCNGFGSIAQNYVTEFDFTGEAITGADSFLTLEGKNDPSFNTPATVT